MRLTLCPIQLSTAIARATPQQTVRRARALAPRVAMALLATRVCPQHQTEHFQRYVLAHLVSTTMVSTHSAKRACLLAPSAAMARHAQYASVAADKLLRGC